MDTGESMPIESAAPLFACLLQEAAGDSLANLIVSVRVCSYAGLCA